MPDKRNYVADQNWLENTDSGQVWENAEDSVKQILKVSSVEDSWKLDDIKFIDSRESIDILRSEKLVSRAGTKPLTISTANNPSLTYQKVIHRSKCVE